MRIAFIGDIVGRPGRDIIKANLKHYKELHNIDFVIANYENASHGFGLTMKNCNELLSCGIDCMTGGNHTFDKKEIESLFEKFPLLRPINYPEEVVGEYVKVVEVAGEKLAIINAMGSFAMPVASNPFRLLKACISKLKEEGIKNIFIDFHAETTSEKRTLLKMFEGEVSFIAGTHTHVGTDDLQIASGTGYITDIGLTGCRDNVIGMDASEPISRALTGVSKRFDVPSKCKSILQLLVADIQDGFCAKAFKIKKLCDGREIISEAWVD